MADHLRQHPPFQYVREEDLLELVGEARVKFHERQEYVFQHGDPCGPYLFVIQQGTVELLRASEQGESLKDMLAEGDLLGLDQLLGSEVHLHSARTCSDVILYALPASGFEALLQGYPAVARYMAAYFSVRSTYEPQRRATAAVEPRRPRPSLPPAAVLAARLARASPDTPLRNIAGRLASDPGGLVVIVDAAERPLGTISDADFRDRVARGQVRGDEAAHTLMQPMRTVAAPTLDTERYVALLLRDSATHVVLTEGGARDGRLLGVLTEADLASACGHHPQMLARQIAHARTVTELCWLREGIELWVARNLTDRTAIDAISSTVDELYRVLLSRLVALAAAELTQDGHRAAGVSVCWFLFGAAARSELPMRQGFEVGLVHSDASSDDEAESAGSYLRALMTRVEAAMRACGVSGGSLTADDPPRCRSLAAWKQAYRAWVRDPILNEAYHALPFFDLRPLCGDLDLARELQRHLLAEVEANSRFIALLANDTLANLPPLTFFQGLVVDEGGTQRTSLDLYRCALQPLADVGRVLALAAGQIDSSSTLVRLKALAPLSPADPSLVDEARDAWRAAVYYRTVNALRTESDGNSLCPTTLDKYDQQLLKSAFRSILAVLERTATHYLFAERR